MKFCVFLLVSVVVGVRPVPARGAGVDDPLRLSVYVTAGDVLKYAATDVARTQVWHVLEPLHVTHLFLEGRRGSEFVSSQPMKKARDFFQAHGIDCSGGIATVPGPGFGTKQNGPLGWLNWEDARTQQDIAQFFKDNAPLFPELIVDDFFCTAECSAQNFVDQAFQSVLAGARELTLFRLDDVMQKHPGDAELARHWPELVELAGKVQGRSRKGVVCYKPNGSDADENLYLMDYLAMIGLPVLPQATYPDKAPVVILPVQAAADTNLTSKLRETLARGGTLVLTPAFVRRMGQAGAELAGVNVGTNALAVTASSLQSEKGSVIIPVPLEVDGAVQPTSAQTVLSVKTGAQTVPLLTFRKAHSGSVFVL